MPEEYIIRVPADYLESFLDSIISHSDREKVLHYLKGSGLTWANYFNLPISARKVFVRACFWAEMYPTVNQLVKIFREFISNRESRSGPINQFLTNCNHAWWASSKIFTDILKKAIQELTPDELFKLSKRASDIEAIVRYAPDSILPLFIGSKKMTYRSDIKEILSKRLKETPNGDRVSSGDSHQ